MDADLDLLLTAVYVTADDLLPEKPENASRGGASRTIPPPYTAAVQITGLNSRGDGIRTGATARVLRSCSAGVLSLCSRT